MRKNNPLTYEERKQIHKWIKKGESLSRIASHIGRSKNAVISEVRRNGSASKYDHELAHDNCIKRKEEADAKRSKNGAAVPNPYLVLKKRIENIEFQMEILIDIINSKEKR